jgi:hypothetical protein
VKHHRWVDLVRTTSVRLALLYALLFGVSAAVLLAVIYWAATGAMSSQLDAGLDAERAVLEDRYRTGGIGDLSAAITERLKKPAHPLSYLLQDPSGKILAGNLPSLPSLRAGRSELEVPPNEPAGNDNYELGCFAHLGSPWPMGVFSFWLRTPIPSTTFANSSCNLSDGGLPPRSCWRCSVAWR